MESEDQQIYPSKEELLENLFFNWKICRNLVVEHLKYRVNRARDELQNSKIDKQSSSKRLLQKQQQMRNLSKSLYQLSTKRKQLQEQNDQLRRQISQQRGDILEAGKLNSMDYELMGKEIQQEIYIQQKDRVQALIDKKLGSAARQNVAH